MLINLVNLFCNMNYISPVTIFTGLMGWMGLVKGYQLVNIRLESTKKKFLDPSVQ